MARGEPLANSDSSIRSASRESSSAWVRRLAYDMVRALATERLDMLPPVDWRAKRSTLRPGESSSLCPSLSVVARRANEVSLAKPAATARGNAETSSGP